MLFQASSDGVESTPHPVFPLHALGSPGIRSKETTGSALILALVSMFVVAFLLAAGTAPAAAGCLTGTGTDEVSVAFIDADGDGTLDTPTGKTRREHARISSTLATALGIDGASVDPDNDVNPQIRVIVDTPTLASGLTSSANFTVFEIFTSDDLELQVYTRTGSGDEDSGYFKLFESASPINLATTSVTVHAVAPSTTTITVDGGPALGGSETVSEPFCEPNVAYAFDERTWLRTGDQRFVLAVPHGGEIEHGTSEQIVFFESVLRTEYGIETNLWETRATWDDPDVASEHFHITSSAVSRESFPGLAAVLDQPDFQDDPGQRLDYQYAASLHGFGNYDGHGLVLGGQAHLESKCYLANRIQQRLIDEGRGAIAFYIWDLDDDDTNNIDLPDSRPVKITTERGSDVGLSGTSSANIVNRLSPADGAYGHGGFQIEESVPLREDAYLSQLVAEELARGLGELILRPSLLDPAATTVCDALEAGSAAPTAEIRGLAFRDLDRNDLRGTGEGGVPGINVELLQGGTAIDSTTTDSEGTYAFPHRAAGTYQIRMALPTGFAWSTPNVGGDDGVDSDLATTNGTSGNLVLARGALLEHVDGGLELPLGTASLGDRVWEDRDESGYQEIDEPGLEAATVELLNPDGIVLATTLTDDQGEYHFDTLAAGSYRLRFPVPSGYVASDSHPDFTTTNSDADPTTGETTLLSLAAGEIRDDLDAGFYEICHDVTLVAYGSSWQTSTTFASGWDTSSFAGSWPEKQGTVGYPASEVQTSITDAGTTAYFRLEFELDDPLIVHSLDLSLFRDDGAVVYLNGQEVLRDNMPPGIPGATTPALSNSRTTVFASPSPSLLVLGTNVLAVEVHEATTDASRLAFDLELEARVCSPCLRELTLPAGQGTFLRDGYSPRGSRSAIEMDGSPVKNGLLAWDFSSLAQEEGVEVLHAELLVWVEDRATQSYRLLPLKRAWDEGTADWTVASDIGGTTEVWQSPGAAGTDDRDTARPIGLATLPVNDVEGVVLLNTTGREVVEGWIDGNEPNHGLAIPGESSGQGGLDITSDEDPVDGPRLRLVYTATCGG